MTVEEVITVLAMQEEILQFNHFTNEDAWALGNLLVAEAKKTRLGHSSGNPSEQWLYCV